MITLKEIISGLSPETVIHVKLSKTVLQISAAHAKEPMLSTIMDKKIKNMETKDGALHITLEK